MTERVGLLYDGGLAKEGKLDYYEFGRASYGFARFISTIEYFRRTNTVPRRITKAQELDVIIEAPRRGSFPIDIIVPAAAMITSELSRVPLEIFVQYIVSQVQRIFPGEEQAILQAAEVQLKIEKQKTKQSEQETERIKAMRDMVADQNVNQRLALEIIKDAQSSQSKVLSAFADVNAASLLEKLELMKSREEAFKKHLDKLEAIPSDKMIRLATKVRPQIAEMGLPLRKSAKVMAVTSGKRRHVIAKFDEEEVRDINSRDLDEEVRSIAAIFKAYDRDTGIGKFDLPDECLWRLTFNVPPGARTALRPKILDAINKDAVRATVRFFRDKSGAFTSAIIQSIGDQEEDF